MEKSLTLIKDKYDIRPFEIDEFIHLCDNYIEISILYKNNPLKYMGIYLIFMENEVEKLCFETRRKLIRSYNICSKEVHLPIIDKMSDKLSKRINELILENFKSKE